MNKKHSQSKALTKKFDEYRERYNWNSHDVYNILNQDGTIIKLPTINKWFVSPTKPTHKPIPGHWLNLIEYRIKEKRNKSFVSRRKKKPLDKGGAAKTST